MPILIKLSAFHSDERDHQGIALSPGQLIARPIENNQLRPPLRTRARDRSLFLTIENGSVVMFRLAIRNFFAVFGNIVTTVQSQQTFAVLQFFSLPVQRRTDTLGNDLIPSSIEHTLTAETSVETSASDGISVFHFRIPISRLRDASARLERSLQNFQPTNEAPVRPDLTPPHQIQLPHVNPQRPIVRIDRSLNDGGFVYNERCPFGQQQANDNERVLTLYNLNASAIPTQYSGRLLLIERSILPRITAVWIPQSVINDINTNVLSDLDYHIFFHPGNYALPNYPWHVLVNQVIQRYMFTHSNYYNDRMGMVFQHIAAAKKTILIFPIGTFTAMGPIVEHHDSLLAYLREIQNYISKTINPSGSINNIGRIAVSGWSSGVLRVSSLLSSLFADPRAQLHQHLKEVYIFDDILGNIISKCRRWWLLSPEHILRVYTKFTSWKTEWVLAPSPNDERAKLQPLIESVIPQFEDDRMRSGVELFHTPKATLLLGHHCFMGRHRRDVDRFCEHERNGRAHAPDLSLWMHPSYLRNFLTHALGNSGFRSEQ